MTGFFLQMLKNISKNIEEVRDIAMRKLLSALFLVLLLVGIFSVTCFAEHREFVGKYGDFSIYVDTDSISEIESVKKFGKDCEGFHCMAYFQNSEEQLDSILTFASIGNGNEVIVEIKAIGAIIECKAGTGLYDTYQFCKQRAKKSSKSNSTSSNRTSNSSLKYPKTKPVYVTTCEINDLRTRKNYGKTDIYIYVPIYRSSYSDRIDQPCILKKCSTGETQRLSVCLEYMSSKGPGDKVTFFSYTSGVFPTMTVEDKELAEKIYDFCQKNTWIIK